MLGQEANFSYIQRSEFSNCIFTVIILEAKFKNLTVVLNKHKTFDLALTSYVLCALSAVVFI